MYKKASSHYHPDRNKSSDHGYEWSVLAKEISKKLNNEFSKMKGVMDWVWSKIHPHACYTGPFTAPDRWRHEWTYVDCSHRRNYTRACARCSHGTLSDRSEQEHHASAKIATVCLQFVMSNAWGAVHTFIYDAAGTTQMMRAKKAQQLKRRRHALTACMLALREMHLQHTLFQDH